MQILFDYRFNFGIINIRVVCMNNKTKVIIISSVIGIIICGIFSAWFIVSIENPKVEISKTIKSSTNESITKNEKVTPPTDIIEENTTNSNTKTTKNKTVPKEESNKIAENNSDTSSNKVDSTKPITLREKNQELISEIKRLYGYKVSYGDEEFWYAGKPSTKLTDEEKVNKALLELKKASKEFPSGFFKTFQNCNGYRVMLFDNINGAAGVASYEIGNDNFLAIDVNKGYLGRVYYHETYHIMEKYIMWQTDNAFSNWNTFNPPGFTYGDTSTKDYTGYDINAYYGYDNPSLISFVSQYAKSSAHEDRAELFADLMFRDIKKPYMKSGFAINEKAKLLASTIRQYFSNSTGARWENFIEW